MTCPTDLELARAASEGPSPELRAHVAACASCAREWDETARMLALARQVRVPMPRADRREELRTQILASAERAPVGAVRAPARRRWIVAAAALAAAAAIALVIVRRAPATHAHGTVLGHAGARFSTSAEAPDEVVTLHDGVIDVEVSKLHPGERFRVVTADTEVEVRGTAFVVTAQLGHVTNVTVRHGRVEVRPLGAAMVVLGAGEAWSAPERVARAPEAGSRPSDAVPARPSDVVPARPSDVVPPDPPAGPALRPITGPGRGSVQRPAPITGPGRGSSERLGPDRGSSDRPAPITGPGRGSSERLTPSTDLSRGSLDRLPPNAGSSVGAPERPARDATPPPQDLATPTPPAALPAARPAHAIAYDEAWAAMRIEAFDRAAATFARVALLDPDGPLAEDATYWYAVALARAKRAEAIGAFRDFLGRYPRSAHAHEASAMLGWLLVDARQPKEAEARFRAAVDDPSPQVRESARAGLTALGVR